jgi:hypothetical protein
MIPAKNVMDVHAQDIVAPDLLSPIPKTFAQCIHQRILVMFDILSVCVCVCMCVCVCGGI